jgi:hypothetical protein
LPNAQAVVKQGDHLKGVAELLANCFEKWETKTIAIFLRK